MRIFVSGNESTKVYYYHRDMIDFHVSCTATSGTLLSVGAFAEITLSNSKCVCFLPDTLFLSILPFFVVEPPPKAVLLWILGLTPPSDCTKVGNFWAQNRGTVLKQGKEISSSFYGEMKCIPLVPSHWGPPKLVSPICRCCTPVPVFEIKPTSLHSKSFPFEVQSLFRVALFFLEKFW